MAGTNSSVPPANHVAPKFESDIPKLRGYPNNHAPFICRATKRNIVRAVFAKQRQGLIHKFLGGAI
jgi:hypothetical protein